MMVPPERWKWEGPQRARCVFRGARYGPAMGAVQPCARREEKGWAAG